MVQWNLSVTTTSIIKFITCDLFSNVFKYDDWRYQFTRVNNFFGHIDELQKAEKYPIGRYRQVSLYHESYCYQSRTKHKKREYYAKF